MTVAQQVVEQATGIMERLEGGGQFYAEGGEKVSDATASRLFRKGTTIHAPNAGAGSYATILSRLGFHLVQVEDWTSSSGDWLFKVKNGLVTQHNRHPGYGFKYSFYRT